MLLCCLQALSSALSLPIDGVSSIETMREDGVIMSGAEQVTRVLGQLPEAEVSGSPEAILKGSWHPPHGSR